VGGGLIGGQCPCGKVFETYYLKEFCSYKCVHVYRPKKQPSTAERLWRRVDKSGPCWLWLGRKNDQGYGIFNVRRKNIRVHRVAWELEHGPIPPGKRVLHKRGCFNRNCVRHLYLGNAKQNTADAVADNRHACGARSNRSLLTDTNVLAIRKSSETQSVLAARYGVSQSNICMIRTRKSWRHLP
jgi:hypothetical protein